MYLNQKAFVTVGKTLPEECSIGRASETRLLTLFIIVYHF